MRRAMRACANWSKTIFFWLRRNGRCRSSWKRNGQRIADGGWALYHLAAQKLEDARWRYQPPSRIARFYGDLGWKSTDAEIHLVGGLGSQNFPIWSMGGRASVPF